MEIQNIIIEIGILKVSFVQHKNTYFGTGKLQQICTLISAHRFFLML